MFVVLTAAPIRTVPPANQPRSSAPEAVPHAQWRPLHKGYGNLSSGTYIREDDDLVVDTPLPIVLRRTYNSADKHERQFGTNTTHPGEWWIYGKGDPAVPWGELILANGGRVHFTRISPGPTRDGAVLRNDTSPGEFNGAMLRWTGSVWEMRLRNGSLAIFASGAGPEKACALIERRDPDGHAITFVRDASGFVSRMESEGKSITVVYDDRHRVVRAYDSSKNEITYTYDDGGRLVRAEKSDGTVRRYAYDSRNYMTRIEEPGRIVENSFDESGRWVHQVVKDAEDDPDPYVATARYVVENGSVTEATFDEGDGLEVHRFNSEHYTVSETWFADTSTPVTFRYPLDSSNGSTRAAMSCTGRFGPVTRDLPLSVEDEEAKLTAIMTTCVVHR
jgi:YD repeat-containing protein